MTSQYFINMVHGAEFYYAFSTRLTKKEENQQKISCLPVLRSVHKGKNHALGLD